VKINGGTPNYWDGAATLYHFNLGLFDLTNPATSPIISASNIENTQNLFIQNLIRGHNYALQVTPASGQSSFTWDYGLAWRFTPDPSIVQSYSNGVYQLLNGDANGDGNVDTIDYGILSVNWSRTNARWDDGDFNGDGMVNSVDFSMMSINYGHHNGTAAASFLENVVPEPASLAMMLPPGWLALRCRARRRY